MYGALTGIYFQGTLHDMLKHHRLPNRPARDIDARPEMPTVSFPALEKLLPDGYRGGHDGGTELPTSRVPLFQGSTGEHLTWLV